MNCPDCGHSIEYHLMDEGCTYGSGTIDSCECFATPELLRQLAAWKAEALAAREYIQDLEYFGNDAAIIPQVREVYRAAKVKDD